MKRLHVTGQTAQLLTWLGPASSAFGGLAVMCCVGWSGLATFLPTIGLGFLIYTANALWLIYLALVFSALGLSLSWRRHRQPWALVIATTGAGLLLYPFYHALDVRLWVGMVYSGIVLSFLAALLDGWLTYKTGRSCPNPTVIARQQVRPGPGVLPE